MGFTKFFKNFQIFFLSQIPKNSALISWLIRLQYLAYKFPAIIAEFEIHHLSLDESDEILNFINIWSTLVFIYVWVYFIIHRWLIKYEKTASSKTEPGCKNFKISRYFRFKILLGFQTVWRTVITWLHQIWNKMRFQDMECPKIF